VTVAFEKSTLLIVVVQFPFGQPASAAVGVVGVWVVRQTLTLPFLISVAGMVTCVVSLNGVLFCPGATLPPGFVQVVLIVL
jgi:hypothetical protein